MGSADHVILASGSPRRRELLELAGIDFEVRPADVDENIPERDPAKLVLELSKRKAEAVRALCKEGTVLAADTIVYLNPLCKGGGDGAALGKSAWGNGDGIILGKPADEDDAIRMLKSLSGRPHQVLTGVCIISPEGRMKNFYEATEVYFHDLSEAEIRTYVATGEPLDKAGAYGIQGKGALLVKKIEGDYLNVVGLPLSRVVRELKNM